MALYVKGALGAFSGKIGNVVGSSWRSIDYLRSLPKPSKKTATAKQIAHRAKFALTMEFLSPMRNLINVGFRDKNQKKMTAFNKATNNLLKDIEGQYPDFVIPYDKVRFSHGSLSNIAATVELNLDGNVEIVWNPSANQLSAAPDDVVNIILYNAEDQDFYIFQDATREDGEYMFNADGVGSGEFHVWILMTQADGLQSSKSKYHGTLDFT